MGNCKSTKKEIDESRCPDELIPIKHLEYYDLNIESERKDMLRDIKLMGLCFSRYDSITTKKLKVTRFADGRTIRETEVTHKRDATIEADIMDVEDL